MLDELPWEDAGARASRRDLKGLNRWMGNYRFLAAQIREAAGGDDLCVEIGAGEGQLADCLGEDVCRVTGVDRVPRPADWPGRWSWEQGDLFDSVEMGKADIVVGSLILHHFDEAALHGLGRQLAAGVKLLVFVEPARRWWGHVLALLPEVTGIHPVTRHDMHVSIDAGFQAGELAEALGLSREEWKIREWEDWRGTVRMVAYR